MGGGGQAPLTSPCPPSNHTITINLTLTFAASWFGHASHVDWAEQDPPNSIAFSSAPRREIDSQPISPLARPAVSQTKAHSLAFLSVADVAPSSGEIMCRRPSSGQMVMQLLEAFFIGGSNPCHVNTPPPPPPPQLTDQGSNRRPKSLRRLRYYSTGGLPQARSKKQI